MGNRVEIQIANLLRRCLRETDAVGRLGENSFVLLLPETDSIEAVFLAERVQQEVNQCSILAENSITTSFGVSTFPDRADSIQSLFAGAESAMAKARRAPGRMSVHLEPPLGPLVPPDVCVSSKRARITLMPSCPG